ncbi:hypothetical protein BGZ58_002550 [Dissophora ornata]|nr:hypothetical protein BGZ58_002550 [Dissophora ornata]
MPTVLHSQSEDLSSPLAASSATSPSEYTVATAVATPSLLHDFTMPDGTIYRFDGTSLVLAPSLHFSNVALQSLPSSLDESPVLNSMSMFTSNNVLLDDGFSSMLMPSYLQMLPAYSLFDNSASPMLTTVPIEEKFDDACTITVRNPTSRAAKKRVLKNNTSTAGRRSSSDSVSSSSSSSIGQQPYSSGSNYSSSNSGKSHRYRKEGAGDYQCPFDGCTYRYNLRRELNRHKNVHLFAGKDRYRCVNCNSGLCRLDSVKRHMEAKGKTECLKRGLYKEFRDNGELLRVRKCKPRWYETAAANAAATSRSVSLKA